MRENLKTMMPVIQRVFQQGGIFRLYPRGESMLPFLRPGRDSVVLAPIEGLPQIGEIVLYRRRDGAYVLHRVVGVDASGLWFAGDHQLVREGPVSEKQLVALTVAVYRGERLVRWPSRGYRVYRRLWRCLGLRRFYLKSEGFITWIKKR